MLVNKPITEFAYMFKHELKQQHQINTPLKTINAYKSKSTLNLSTTLVTSYNLNSSNLNSIIGKYNI